MDANELKALTDGIGSAVNGAMAPLKASVEALTADVTALKNAKTTTNTAGLIPGVTTTTPPPAEGATSTSYIKTYNASMLKRMRASAIATDIHKGAGIEFGGYVRAILHAQKFHKDVKAVFEEFGYPELVPIYEGHQKALSEGVFADGGALIPQDFVASIIELLVATAVVRSTGVPTMPMPRGTLTMPKELTDVTASYLGENQVIAKSQPTVGQLSLAARKLAAIVPFSNDLYRDASPMTDIWIRNRIVTRMGLAEDLAFITGSGTQYTPKGMKNWAISGNVFGATQAGAAATLSEVLADGWKAIGKLQDNNVQVNERACWFWAPRTTRFLAQLRDGVGNLIFAAELATGKWLGVRFKESTQITTNTGSGTNESYILLSQMDHALIGDNLNMEVTFHLDGVYDSGNGLVSGVSSDQSVIRAISKHDFVMEHGESVAVITAVKWGA